jgi:hypothetical protein
MSVCRFRHPDDGNDKRIKQLTAEDGVGGARGVAGAGIKRAEHKR